MQPPPPQYPPPAPYPVQYQPYYVVPVQPPPKKESSALVMVIVILLVIFIVVPLIAAGFLVFYMQGLSRGPAGPGEIATPIGVTTGKYRGNYTITIAYGNYQAADLKYMIKKSDGAVFVQDTMSTVKGVALGGSNNITFTDNDDDGMVNPGDAIRVWGRDGGGTVGDDWRLELTHTGRNKVVLNTQMVPGG